MTLDTPNSVSIQGNPKSAPQDAEGQPLFLKYM